MPDRNKQEQKPALPPWGGRGLPYGGAYMPGLLSGRPGWPEPAPTTVEKTAAVTPGETFGEEWQQWALHREYLSKGGDLTLAEWLGAGKPLPPGYPPEPGTPPWGGGGTGGFGIPGQVWEEPMVAGTPSITGYEDLTWEEMSRILTARGLSEWIPLKVEGKQYDLTDIGRQVDEMAFDYQDMPVRELPEDVQAMSADRQAIWLENNAYHHVYVDPSTGQVVSVEYAQQALEAGATIDEVWFLGGDLTIQTSHSIAEREAALLTRKGEIETESAKSLAAEAEKRRLEERARTFTGGGMPSPRKVLTAQELNQMLTPYGVNVTENYPYISGISQAQLRTLPTDVLDEMARYLQGRGISWQDFLAVSQGYYGGAAPARPQWEVARQRG